MLPIDFPVSPHFSLDASMQAAKELGGDFYDFFPMGDNEYVFCVADVSDKGVASALFMSVTKAFIKSRSREVNSTSEVVTWVNNEIAQGNDSCMFITLFIAILDTSTGQVRYTNAGHNPPYVRKANGEVLCITDHHGPMVGAMGGIDYGETTLQLNRGDSMVLFTDGVTEAMNHDKELYGESRLEALLEASQSGAPQELVKDIRDAVRTHAAGADQSDDITILVFNYTGD